MTDLIEKLFVAAVIAVVAISYGAAVPEGRRMSAAYRQPQALLDAVDPIDSNATLARR